MSEGEIFHSVSELVTKTMKREVEISMTTDFRRDLQLDSLKLLELVVAIEDRFEVCLDPGDEAALITVGDVVRFLATRVPK
ncbi:MAG: acyl carrier protein [Myxococcota bacterium]|nr:acyl carrier protein [Myxococcota bacterium]